MKWLIELIAAIIKSLFTVTMDNPYEKTEEIHDVSDKTTDNPDDVFKPADW